MTKLTIKERLSLPGSKWGNFFKGFVFYLFLVAGATAEIASATDLVRQDWVPVWLRVTLVAASIVSRVGGMLSVHPEAAKVALETKEHNEQE